MDHCQKRLPHYQILSSLGFDFKDYDRPLIGIANAFSEIVPGHANLRQIAEYVKKGIYMSGGQAVEFGVIGCCDNVCAGHDGNHYSLPSRETIADSVEIMAIAHKLDGLVLLASCDKIVPGMLMGALRANIPTIMVPGGPMLGGPSYGEKLKTDGSTVEEAYGAYQAGKVDWDTVKKLSASCSPTCGSCAFYGTANTMCCSAEALGMVLPGGAAIPAVFGERFASAKRSGEQVVELVQKNIRPKDIITRKAIKNVIRYLMASGGSSNAVIHFTAIAHEIKIPANEIMDEFDRQSELIPHIVKIFPASNKNVMEDYYYSGGVPRALEMLKSELDLDALTVTGKTVGENLAAHSYPMTPCDDELIRPLNRPFSNLGGLAVMRGNLAPNTGVSKPAAIAEEVRRFTGEAICFDCEEDAAAALVQRKIKPGHVVVIRYEGPKGGPGMREMSFILKAMVGQGLAKCTALVTDGRFSGTNNGCFVGHVSPEAAAGGPIALVEDGDKITIDVMTKQLTLHVDDETLAKRRAAWTYSPRKVSGYLARYAALTTSADQGAVLLPGKE